MSKVVFAILAHVGRPLLDDLISNVRTAAPGSQIVLYNGGSDEKLFEGLDVPVCPYSKPLHHDWPTSFPWDIMRWLGEENTVYDYLVILECDMLLIRPGFPEHLDQIMADSDYMAPHFSSIPKLWSPWSIGRRARWKWHSSGWGKLLGTDYPYGCLGAGQVFGRRYIERLLAHPEMPEIVRRAQNSRLRAFNEIVYPSLAVSMGCNPIRNPQSNALLLRRHSTDELLTHAYNRDCYLIHKVGMTLGAPDRVYVRNVCQQNGLPELVPPPVAEWPSSTWSTVRRGGRRTVRKIRRLYRDITTILLPEQRTRSARKKNLA